MNKKDLSERDICSMFIGPVVKRAGWDGMMQIREEVNFTKGTGPRYYQVNAINAAVEAIAKGQNRILLVMALAPARHTPHFRLSRGCGRPAARSTSCFLPLAVSENLSTT
jgi:type I site-specific restriction endonuclease